MGNVIVSNITRTPVENGSNWGSVAAPSSGLATPDLFYDDFGSGDFSATGGTAINTVDFDWGQDVRVQVVNKTTSIWEGSGSIDVPLVDPIPANWDPITGSNALKFKYKADGSGNSDEQKWSELRFDANTAQTSMYVGYWVRVPSNYSRANADGGSQNNKWFDMLWGFVGDGSSTDYTDGNLPRLEMQDTLGSASACNINMQVRQQGANGFENSTSYTDFITPADAGRWMHCVYYLGESSGTDVADAKLRFWRRWEDEETYTLINSLDNLVIQNTVGSGTNGWSGGYLMGYANGTYVADTNWCIDAMSMWSSDPTNGDLTP